MGLPHSLQNFVVALAAPAAGGAAPPPAGAGEVDCFTASIIA
jgi:hypothetical protein